MLTTTLKRIPATIWAATVFLAVAIGLFAWEPATGRLGAWAPNLGASCIEIGITIAVVDRIVQRTARRELRPRRERAKDELVGAVKSILVAASVDYMTTRSQPGAPADPSSLSLAELMRVYHDAEGTSLTVAPALPDAAQRAAERLERAITLDRELLDVSLVVSTEALVSSIRTALRSLQVSSDFAARLQQLAERDGRLVSEADQARERAEAEVMTTLHRISLGVLRYQLDADDELGGRLKRLRGL